MSLYERLAFSLIGTPLERPAHAVRQLTRLRMHRKHPELQNVFREDTDLPEVFRRAIHDGMNCIDIGCHLGSMLNLMIKLSPRGQHIAVEPLPYKAHWLQRRYTRVEVHQVALHNAEGEVSFFQPKSQTGYSSLRRPDGPHDVQQLLVRCRRLDDLVPANRKIGFMKIDVEGAELGVFQGATRVLRESKPVILFECTASCIEQFHVQPRQVYSLLSEEHGYNIYLPRVWLQGGDPLTLAQFERAMVYPFEAFNFVAALTSCSSA